MATHRKPWRTDICYYCKKLGHWKTNCPTKKEHRNNVRIAMERYPIGQSSLLNNYTYQPLFGDWLPTTLNGRLAYAYLDKTTNTTYYMCDVNNTGYY
jgi:hypothetical protein